MIYLESAKGAALIILEPGNLERLKQGYGLTTSQKGGISIMYTPDVPWLMEKLEQAARAGDVNGAKIEALLAESLTREPVTDREDHPPQELFRDGKKVMEDS